jgi:hypothetical protein
MDHTTATPRFARAIRIVHGALVTGVVLVGGLFLFLARVPGPALGGERTLGTAVAAVALSLVIVAASSCAAGSSRAAPSNHGMRIGRRCACSNN